MSDCLTALDALLAGWGEAGNVLQCSNDPSSPLSPAAAVKTLAMQGSTGSSQECEQCSRSSSRSSHLALYEGNPIKMIRVALD